MLSLLSVICLFHLSSFPLCISVTSSTSRKKQDKDSLSTPLLIPIFTPDRAKARPFGPALVLSSLPSKRDENGQQKGRKEHGPKFPMCGLCGRQRGSRGPEDLQVPSVLVHLCACEPLLQTATNHRHQDSILYKGLSPKKLWVKCSLNNNNNSQKEFQDVCITKLLLSQSLMNTFWLHLFLGAR